MALYLLSVVMPEGGLTQTDDERKAADAAVDAFNDEAQAKGAWVFAGGLEAPDTATMVDGRGAETLLTDGPYAETKEFTAGFWVLRAADLDEALRWAARGSKACGARVEVRAFLDPTEQLNEIMSSRITGGE
jgi:hypothetical protein